MELRETVQKMTSSDYKERFIAEYWQTKIRYEKLKAFNNKIEAAEATTLRITPIEAPKHDCPADMLRHQESVMAEYLHILEVRAVIEGVDLNADILLGDTQGCNERTTSGEAQHGEIGCSPIGFSD